MTINVIGDIHGRISWKQIVKRPADFFVFLGDYFDSREGISGEQQIRNFKDILDFRENNPERVRLLLGNHDYHYLEFTQRRYSLYQSAYATAIRDLLKPAIDKGWLTIGAHFGDYLFTHAGVTTSWAQNNGLLIDHPEASINELLQAKPEVFDFTPGAKAEPTGDEICQSPLWVRPNSLVKDAWGSFTQIIGHTIQPEIQRRGKVFFVDTLGTSGQYLTLRENLFEIKMA